MKFQITVRHGRKVQQYLSLAVDAPDAPAALRQAADEIPQEVAGDVDLVELREAPDFDKRMEKGDWIG
jgi:hypothetical protein